MNINYQLEIENAPNEHKELIKQFQKEVENGMNLYYDLWTILFDPYNDYDKIKELSLGINKFNEQLSNKFNRLMKFEPKNEKIILVYEQYLSNYLNDKSYAKFLTEKFNYYC